MSLFNKTTKIGSDAFIELVKEHTQMMYKTAYAILHNDADVADAVQNTILDAYEKLEMLREPKHFKAWLIRILINNCRLILRERKKIMLSEEGFPEQEYLEDYDSEMNFKELIGVVDEEYQVLLTLYYASGFTINEIAQMTDMNVNTVKTQLARARKQLRRYLDEK